MAVKGSLPDYILPYIPMYFVAQEVHDLISSAPAEPKDNQTREIAPPFYRRNSTLLPAKRFSTSFITPYAREFSTGVGVSF